MTLVIALTSKQLSAADPPKTPDPHALQSLAKLQPIDVHVHVFQTAPALQAMIERLNLTLINIMERTIHKVYSLARSISLL